MQARINTFKSLPMISIRCFQRMKSAFTQAEPKLQNEFLSDIVLQKYLKRTLPQEVLNTVVPDLTQFGNRVVTEIEALGRECELHPPTLTIHDAWGNRINDLWTCEAWKRQHYICAEEGLISIAYERKFHEWSRLYQMCKMYLHTASSGLYSAPIAMTDGAAKTIEVLDCKAEVFKNAYAHLTSRNPKQFWTSGQWMTEKRGGSDVANGTETIGVPQEDGTYRLFGYKWFSSATDADIALTLARVTDQDGKAIQNSKGLTLFYLETHKNDGSLNNFQMVRLKNKLGTRQLPTAELLLEGTVAHKMSSEGRGVAGISSMLTLTRIHNSIAAVAAMRRIMNLAQDYSHRRLAFGKMLIDHPLHTQTLFRMEVERRGSLLLLLEIARWVGLDDCKMIKEEEKLLLRLLHPVLKLYTAKQAISVVSEGLEAFGGQGYMEDTGLPAKLRDAQVLPIWEGTTNILSLDVLRCLEKTKGCALSAFNNNIEIRLKNVKSYEQLSGSAQYVLSALKSVTEFARNNPDKLEIAARDFSYSLARIYIGALLLENAVLGGMTRNDVHVALRWCSGQELAPVISNDLRGAYAKNTIDNERSVVTEGYKS